MLGKAVRAKLQILLTNDDGSSGGSINFSGLRGQNMAKCRLLAAVETLRNDV